MKKILKRGLSLVLTLVILVGLMPVTAFAAVDSSGRPTDLNNTLVLSIYTPEGSFPGEPAMHGSEDYISFSSSFAKTSASGKFKDSAASELKEDKQQRDGGKRSINGIICRQFNLVVYIEKLESLKQQTCYHTWTNACAPSDMRIGHKFI